MLAHTFLQLADNIMVGQLGTAELAAVSLGNSFVFIAMSLGLGFSTAITPLTSESDGQNDVKKGQNIFYHGFILCAVIGLFLALAILFARPLLYVMNQPEEVVVLTVPYLKWVALSLFPLVTFQALKQFADGLSETRPAMYATIFANGINILFNYLLIFGMWGFPKMGVEGAGIGTFVSRILMIVFIIIYLRNHRKFIPYIHFKWKKPEFAIFKKIFKLGFPSALQTFFEVLFFVASIWMAGLLGKNPQAANQIAFNLSAMTFMFAMGLSVAAMIRIGNQKGLKDFFALRRIAFSLFLLVIIIDIFTCLFFIIFHEQLPWIYLSDDNSQILNDVHEVVKLAATLLIISGFFQIFDGLQAVILGALRGLQDVYKPTLLIFIAYIVFGIPVSYYLGIKTPMGAVGIWIGLLVGLFMSSLLLFIRFNSLSKKYLS